MRAFSHLILVAALVASTSAMASPDRLTDVQYMQAARCRALIASPALGGGDTSQIDALLKRESAGRVGYVYEKADQMQTEAARMARIGGPERKANLIAERNGVCETFNSAMTAAAKAPVTAN